MNVVSGISATNRKRSKLLAVIWELFLNLGSETISASGDRSNLLALVWELFMTVVSGSSATNS